MASDRITASFIENSIDSLSDLLIWISADGKLFHANKSALDFYGYDLESFNRLSIDQLGCNFSRENWNQHWLTLRRQGVLKLTMQHRSSNGLHYPVEVADTYNNIDGVEFSVAAVRCIDHRDVHQQRLQLMQFSLDQMTESVFWIDRDAHITYVNDAACRNLGYSYDELVQMSVQDIDPHLIQSQWDLHWEELKQRRSVIFESTQKTRDGQLIPIEVKANLVQGFDQEYNCFFVRDTRERQDHEMQVRYLATHDPLTDLPNRRLLNDRIEQSLLRSQRNEKHTALMLIDLDKYKRINDRFGHEAGDQILTEMTKRISLHIRASDTVARMAGDEFAVLLDGINQPRDCAAIAQNLLHRINQPLQWGEHTLELSATIGIALYPDDGGDGSALLRNANIAVSKAKTSIRGVYRFFKREMGDQVIEHMSMVSCLQQSLDQDHFVLHYQPVYDLKTRDLVGAEALLRMNDPEKGLIPPNQFIPVAEETGLIVPMGSWVIEQTCRQNREWLKQGLHIVPVAINLSARQLRGREIIDVICKSLSDNQLLAKNISFELTESMIMEDPLKVIAILSEMKNLGLSIAIDDFGTGYSSLSYLHQFPIDIIKIDREFVKDLGADPKDAIIANAIISLAHSMGYKVLAEGIETESQGIYLEKRGCDLVQGFFYGRPIVAEEFEKLLRMDGKADN